MMDPFPHILHFTPEICLTRVPCTPWKLALQLLRRGTQPSQLKSCRLHTLQLTKIVLNSSQITDQLQPVRASYK